VLLAASGPIAEGSARVLALGHVSEVVKFACPRRRNSRSNGVTNCVNVGWPTWF